MDNECGFKYGERLEFSNHIGYGFIHPYIGRFLAYHPDGKNGKRYVDFNGYFWKYARRLLPNIKTGHPVVVRIGGLEVIRIFSHFNEEGNIEVYPEGQFEKNSYTIAPDDYKLLENYNYDA